MTHTRQRGRWDCAVAVAATIADLPYLAAAEHAPKIAKGVWRRGMRQYLEDVTGRQWRLLRHRPMTVKSSPCARPRVLLIADPSAPSRLHWIAVANCMAFDPEADAPAKISEYPRRGWRVVGSVVRSRRE